jgi:D-aminoacyl-tRNA deacylase
MRSSRSRPCSRSNVRAVVQRVTQARVRVDERITGEIGAGLAVLVGVAIDDSEADARWMGEKIANLRIFCDESGAMNRSVLDTSGGVLLISQFTLHGDARKGRRPSFITAAKEPLARPLYHLVGEILSTQDIQVGYGEFGADMQVSTTGP